jgi:nucleoside-diphosphate-sugar epimerase
MATYVVTGGGGFIGSNLVRALLEQGEKVRVVDNFATGRRENLAGIEEQIVLHEADLRDLPALMEALQGADYVLHQGALPSVPRSVKDPVLSTEINVNGTLNLLLAARDCEVRRVVMASSSSVYGANPELPKHEGMRPLPISPYAASKLANEAFCAAFTHVYGLETVCLRYFNVFGPRQDPASQYAAVIPLFINALLQGERPTIFGDGEQSRDFTYVANVVHANLLAATAPGAGGVICNVACNDRITLNDLVGYLNEFLGTSIEPIYEAERAGDVKHSQADIAVAREKLGYEPQVSFREGLQHTVEWYQAVAAGS